MGLTTVTIELEFNDAKPDSAELRKKVNEFLTEMIENDSLEYEVSYEETVG